jgi:hypothetical protein
MDLHDRRRILRQFSTGEIRVVSNCMVLTEGFDEPTVDCVIMCRPTKSRSLYVQQLGRGTRIAPGKADCLILDLVGSTTRHDLITAASLFGVHHQVLDRGESVVEAVARQQIAAAQAGERDQLVAQTIDLFRSRRVNWVHGSGETFVLPYGGGHVVLRPDGDRWTAMLVMRDRREVIAAHVPLDYAQGAAEDYVRRSGVPTLVDPQAAWRNSPATAKQIAALRRFRIRIAPDLTKGAASDLLSAAIATRCA